MKEILKIDDFAKVIEPTLKDLIKKLSTKDALHLLEFFGLTYALVYASDNFDFDYADNIVQTLNDNGDIIEQKRNCSKHIHFGKSK